MPGRSHLEIATEDPRSPDVEAMLATHLAFARGNTPPEDAHALELDGLLEPSLTFVAARRDGRLMAIGALRELSAGHGELKSMHTAEDARGQGIGRAMLAHLLDLARRRGYSRVSLETGSHPDFLPARAMYEKAGFATTGPFGDYGESPHSTYMTLALRGEDGA